MSSSLDAALDELNQLRKENEELKQKLNQFEWQPIETAPKPRKIILLSDGHNNCCDECGEESNEDVCEDCMMKLFVEHKLN